MRTYTKVTSIVGLSLLAAGCEHMQSAGDSISKSWSDTRDSWRTARMEAGRETYERDASIAYSNSGQGGGFSSSWYRRDASGAGLGSTSYRGQDSSNSGDRSAGRPGRDGGSDSPASISEPDRSVLSMLHAKNQEEVQIGRLAQSKGTTEQVRGYGADLVRDHSRNDAKLMSLARDLNITLSSPDWQPGAAGWRGNEQSPGMNAPSRNGGSGMTANGSGQDRSPVDRSDRDRMDQNGVQQDQTGTMRERRSDITDRADRQGRSADWSANAPGGSGAYVELQNASSSEFDRLFLQKMHAGHGEVIDKVDQAVRQTHDQRVRSYLDSTLVALREHERRAQELMSMPAGGERGRGSSDRDTRDDGAGK